MAYRLLANSTVEQNLRSIASQQIDRAIAEIEDATLDRNVAVHQVRKRCKKVRGLIRLVRPVFDDYREENARFRDTARPLSDVRDSQAIVDCYDRLLGCFSEQLNCGRLAPIREQLLDRRRQLVRDLVVQEDRLGSALTELRDARSRVERWTLHSEGFPAIAEGLKTTYKRARHGLRDAYRGHEEQSFHEWRKRVKYHLYHSRLLRGIWPEMMKARVKAVRRLSTLLGDEHDLVVLRQTASNDESDLSARFDMQLVIGLIDRRRAELQAEARPLGEQLFAEKPKQLVARYSSYWTIAHDCARKEKQYVIQPR